LLAARGCRKIILYIWRPEFARALSSITHDVSCYHIDDEYSFSDVEVSPDPVEMALIVAVDQVFVHSPGLIDKKGGLNSNTTFVPNGVDYQAYAQTVPEPADLAGIPHPRIGYTGLIKKQLDWPLLLHLARKHRPWSFVFVGPRSPHPEICSILNEISALPNVYFLGGKSVRELAAYPKHFDVCLMPYAGNNDTSKYIYPLKLHEYLASGRPAISSPIRSVRDFSNVITLANGPDDWTRAITDALGERANCLESVAARQKVARQYDWDKLVHRISQTLCERLGSGISRQFHEIASGHCDRERTVRG
jgi:glycosyltransferase involved in cell wall biosynthesis